MPIQPIESRTYTWYVLFIYSVFCVFVSWFHVLFFYFDFVWFQVTALLFFFCRYFCQKLMKRRSAEKKHHCDHTYLRNQIICVFSSPAVCTMLWYSRIWHYLDDDVHIQFGHSQTTKVHNLMRIGKKNVTANISVLWMLLVVLFLEKDSAFGSLPWSLRS